MKCEACNHRPPFCLWLQQWLCEECALKIVRKKKNESSSKAGG